jgi:hypothetical protein
MMKALTAWGQFLGGLAADDNVLNLPDPLFQGARTAKIRAGQYNGWFSPEFVDLSLREWSTALQPAHLERWMPHAQATQPQTIALILAGNLPLVGLHDVLSVWVSGHRALVKLSSDDKELFPPLAAVLFYLEPEFNDLLRFSAGQLHDFNAVIATGSNNSARYFEYYFGKYPHIIRKNRTSCAILTGVETPDDLGLLANDLFQYFGLGCRSVTQLWIPEDFDLNRVFAAILPWDRLMDNNKYHNNYQYQRAIFMLNRVPFLENGFVLFREHLQMGAPVSVVHYQRYSRMEQVNEYLQQHAEELQCVVGSNQAVGFGQTQQPSLWDYADGVDTLAFLASL